MSEPASTTAVVKTGIGVFSAGLLYASAVVADAALPAPTVHGAVEVLVASLLAWVVRELKQKKAVDAPSGATSTTPSWRESMLRLAEEAAIGTKDIGEKLNQHREEFTEFRGETRSRLKHLEHSVNTRNKIEDTGDIPRPTGRS